MHVERLLIVVGLAALLVGAEVLVRGGTGLASRLGSARGSSA
jgi:hypothetical protein